MSTIASMSSVEQVIDLGRQALITTLVIASPFLVAAIVIGLITAFLQTITQIQDPSISFVPKLIGTIVVAAAALPWLVERMMEFSSVAFSSLALMTGSG